MPARPNADKASTRTRWIAVEGPCCAGKTTLIQGLLSRLTARDVVRVACYADHVGGGRFLPRPVPESLAEDAVAVNELLTIEADRVAAARSSGSDLALLDRSVHTLLAHRYALERVAGLACYTPARRVIAQSEAPAWPDLVLYLDVTHQVILDRNRGKFPPGSIFIDRRFNAGIRDYFANLANTAVAWLDADAEAGNVLAVAAARVNELLHSHDP